MKDQNRRWARLLPDYRTLYLSFDELDRMRQHGETDAEVLMRSLQYAQAIAERDGPARLLAADFVRRAGLPLDDTIGAELAMALVVRARFLAEHAPVALAAAGDGDGDRPRAE